MSAATTASAQAPQTTGPTPTGMHTRTLLSPHLVLAVLTILSLGALAWSVAAAPPIARSLLHQGAGNTAAVSSVQVDESISQVSGGHVAVLDSIRLLLERPDRVEQVQQSNHTLVIGSKVYLSPDGGKTWSLDTQAGRVDVSQVFDRVLAPMQLLQSASTVRETAGQTRFTLDVPLSALENAMHLGLPASGAPTTVPVTVTVQGEFVTGFAAELTESGQQLLVQERYTHLDRLPALVAPAVTAG